MALRPSDIPTDKAPVQAAGLSQASLVLLHPPMPDIGRRRVLSKEIVVVGREDSADFPVARSSISRRHAELRCVHGRWEVADMGSTNGTFLNDVEVEDAVLRDGDHIQFGDALFKFVQSVASYRFHDTMHELIDRDGLTSLYNRDAFIACLESTMSHAAKRETDAVLIVMDVDGLAELNQKHGRICGDMFLRRLAQNISSSTSKEVTAARIDGGEFAVLIPNMALNEALVWAEELREKIDSTEYSYEGAAYEMTISLGVAASAEGELGAGEIVLEARAQMHSAKERGRNCLCP